jgi:transcriptional regulator of acetoin/glycerol metabolism
MVNGTEHFTVASHQWSCAASPIFDAQKNLLGVIDLTCPLETAHPFMLGMVSSLAHTIEQEIIDQSNRNKISLIRQAIELAGQYSGQPFIVVDQNDTVVAASKPIRERFPSYFGKPAEEILYPQFFIAKQSQVFSAGHEKIGTCMLLLPQPLKQPLKSPVPVQKEPFLFRGEAGTSRVFQETLERVKLVAATNTTCFISGETGTGKELIAKAIHENSCRKDGPFIAVNCGAIPKDLLESELFGYAEGAFTGAKRQGYKGKFEQADGGTLFLDEIGELSFSAQTALLRVLQERKVTPVGASREIPVDIRFITATHRDLLQLIEEGSFRQDLYYRLFVYPIHVPSLRERKEDIPALVAYICRHYNWQLDLDQTAMQILAGYSWPGNIRELLNVLENLHITIQARTTDIEDFLGTLLSRGIHAAGETPAEQPPEAPVLNMREKIQRDMMIEALKHAKGNAAAAAKLLDIPRSTFYKKLKKYGL